MEGRRAGEGGGGDSSGIGGCCQPMAHPLLKASYTRPETTSVGNVDFSPRLAETKRNQEFLEKSGLEFFWAAHDFGYTKLTQNATLGGSQLNNTREIY